MGGLSERKTYAVVSLVALLPIVALLASSFATDVRDVLNPCFTWGAVSGGRIVVSTGGPCPSAEGTSETIPQTLVRNALVPGGILLGGALGVAGVVRGRLILLGVGSAVLFLESIPLVLGGAFVLTLAPATFLAWRALIEGRLNSSRAKHDTSRAVPRRRTMPNDDGLVRKSPKHVILVMIVILVLPSLTMGVHKVK